MTRPIQQDMVNLALDVNLVQGKVSGLLNSMTVTEQEDFLDVVGHLMDLNHYLVEAKALVKILHDHPEVLAY